MQKLTPQHFGHLRVLHLRNPRGKRVYWLCRCEARYHGRVCGTVKEVRDDALRTEAVRERIFRLQAVFAPVSHSQETAIEANRYVTLFLDLAAELTVKQREALEKIVAGHEAIEPRRGELGGGGLELASGSRLLVRFSVTAALRHLFALARRFRFEGFGIGAAIHANPDLLSNVRALLCAQSILILYSPATPTRRAILFLSAISFGLHPSVQHSSCDTEAKA